MGDDSTIAGRVLADKYLLIDRLGGGGFGSIWRAEHQVLKSPVAVKLIDLEVARREGAVERFLREAQATAVLRSPHVVQILDYGLDKRVENGVEYEQPFIVMELLEGENVAERLERVGPMEPLEVVHVVTHVARAIGRAHELGIIHRDLKPENIFLVNNGDTEIAKVLDFGVAKIVNPQDLAQNTCTQTGSMVGTPYYMSPEQAQGNKAVDYRSDLWALGVITFEMLTGTKPFDSDALGDLILSICVRELPVPSQFGPVPAGFDAWFAHAVARDPNHRFQSARELALALLKLVENADGDIRNTRLDEPRLSLNPDNSRPALSPNEAAPIAEIPSRPINKAFAATVRDDTLARSPSDTTPLSPALSIEFGSTEEERLAPWALAGMALLALAAGAAVVYGLFHLLRDPNVNDANHAANPSASYESVTPNRPTRFAKRKSDVAASNRPNPSQGTSKSPETTNNAPIATKRDVEDANVTTEAHTTPAAATSVTLPRSHVEPTEPLKNDSPRNDTAPFRDAKPLTQSTTEPFATNIAEPSAHPTQLPTLVEPSSSVTYPIDALPMVTDQSN